MINQRSVPRFLLFCALGAFEVAVFAQQPQIPTLQICLPTTVVGHATVFVDARSNASLAGSFDLEVEITCDFKTTHGYPTGSLKISNIKMTDTPIAGDILASGVDFEQLTSAGHATPTAYLSSKCEHHPPAGTTPIGGCRIWLLVSDNFEDPQHRRTPDVVSVLVLDGIGHTVFYATGPVARGHIRVTP